MAVRSANWFGSLDGTAPELGGMGKREWQAKLMAMECKPSRPLAATRHAACPCATEADTQPTVLHRAIGSSRSPVPEGRSIIALGVSPGIVDPRLLASPGGAIEACVHHQERSVARSGAWPCGRNRSSGFTPGASSPRPREAKKSETTTVRAARVGFRNTDNKGSLTSSAPPRTGALVGRHLPEVTLHKGNRTAYR